MSDPDRDSGFYITPVLGWRAWRTTITVAGTVRLESVNRSVNWPTDEPLTAACLATPDGSLRCDRAPGTPCVSPSGTQGCGIYIAKTWMTARSACASGHGGTLVVHGLCWGWGRVAVYTEGWRVERARPACLLWKPDDRKTTFPRAALLDHLADSYGIRLVTFGEAAQYMETQAA